MQAKRVGVYIDGIVDWTMEGGGAIKKGRFSLSLSPSLSLSYTHTYTHIYIHTCTHTHILENIHKHAFLEIPKKSAYEQCNTLPIVVYKAYLQLRTYIYNYITYIHTFTLNLYIIFIIYSLTITCTHPNCPD